MAYVQGESLKASASLDFCGFLNSPITRSGGVMIFAVYVTAGVLPTGEGFPLALAMPIMGVWIAKRQRRYRQP